METEELPQLPVDVAWSTRQTLRFTHMMVPAYFAPRRKADFLLSLCDESYRFCGLRDSRM